MSINNKYPNISPSLNLDFTNSNTIDPRITFSRASAATYYDGKTVAKAEENLFVNSQSFGISTWIPAFASIVGNSISAPDGTLTATKLLADNSQNYHAIRQGNSLPVGNVYTMSVYAKAAEFSRLYFSDLANGRVAASFDLVALSSANPANSPGYLSSSVSDVGGGWRRCVVTFSAGSSTISLAFAGYPDTGATLGLYGANYIGDGTSGIYIWGAQLEQRSQVTAYTPTTTQPITNYIPVLQTAPAGVPRFDHNPVTGESLGLLVEEQRTNLLTYSEQFGNAAFTKASASVQNNEVVAPDGTFTADKMIESVGVSTHFVSSITTLSAGGTYTLSVYAKAAGRNTLSLQFVNGSAGTNCFFDLASGTNTANNTFGGYGGSVGTPTITHVGNGWYRCSTTVTIDSTAVQSIRIGTPPSNGDGYSGIYLWGAQLETGAFPTSYIKTEASQVTRVADSASMIGANFSSWYRQGEGTIFTEFDHFGIGLPEPVARPVSITDGQGSGANALTITAQYSNFSATSYYNGNPEIYGQIIATLASNKFYKAALAYKANSATVSGNGNLSMEDTSGNIPLVSTLLIGQSRFGSGNIHVGHIKRITYYPKRLTAAQLQALTA